MTPIEMPGSPLGLLEEIETREIQLTMHPGDLLIFYTDGLPERQNHKGKMWDFDEMEKKLYQICQLHLSIEEIARRIFCECDDFAEGTDLSDDMSIIIIKNSDDAANPNNSQT